MDINHHRIPSSEITGNKSRVQSQDYSRIGADDIKPKQHFSNISTLRNSTNAIHGIEGKGVSNE